VTATIEIIRLFYSVLIHQDRKMADQFGNAASRNSNVICRLGDIPHILLDNVRL
jgi:hypothetical protein